MNDLLINEEGMAEYTKGKKTILHPISDELMQFLKGLQPKKTGYVFINPETNKPYTDIKKSFNTAIKKAGIENFKFHDLRRTFSTWLLQEGADLKTIQQLLGHYSISVTERYLGLTQDSTRRAVNLLKVL